MRYKLFCSHGLLDRGIRGHELIDVVYGDSIEAVAEELMEVVEQNLSGQIPFTGCDTVAFGPEPVSKKRRTKRYRYEMMGAILPPNNTRSTLIEYGVIEEPEI